MTADSIPAEKRGLGYSITTLVGAISILAPMFAAFLYVTQGLVLGMRIAYWTVTIFFAAAAITRFQLKETLEPGTCGAGLRDAFKACKKAVAESFGVWKVLPQSALTLFLVYSIPSFFVRMCTPYYVIYATDVLHVDEFQYAMMLTWQSIIYYGSVLPIGKLVDRAGRKNPLIASSVLFAPGMLLFIYGDMPKLYVAFLLFAIGGSLMWTAYPSLQADIVPREHRGKMMGFTNFADNLLASISLIAGGFLYESVSSQLPFFLPASMILTPILTLVLIYEPEKREK